MERSWLQECLGETQPPRTNWGWRKGLDAEREPPSLQEESLDGHTTDGPMRDTKKEMLTTN